MGEGDSFSLCPELACRNLTYDLRAVKYNCKIKVRVKYWVEDNVLALGGVCSCCTVLCWQRRQGVRQSFCSKSKKAGRGGVFPLQVLALRGQRKASE